MKRLIGLQRKFSRQKKGSKSRYDTKHLIQREYEKLGNRRRDKANKIYHTLTSLQTYIVMQDENISGWQNGLFGKEVQNSALGTLKDKLKRNPRVLVIDRFFPSTKLCPVCGNVKEDVTLKDRTYVCTKCGYREDRDVKSAKTILLAHFRTNSLLLCGTHEYSSGESVRLCCLRRAEQTRKAI